MIIVSQNLTNYNVPLPENCIFRINLAWVESIDELNNILEKNQNYKIFLDLPIGRTKPPNNKYSFEEIIQILENKNIKFFAISNVDSKADIEKYISKIPEHVTLVPKIESPDGVKNISQIVSVLKGRRIIMLDHDDLFSNTIKRKETPDHFQKYFSNLVQYCEQENITVLRTIGVIFSELEKRTTNFIK